MKASGLCVKGMTKIVTSEGPAQGWQNSWEEGKGEREEEDLNHLMSGGKVLSRRFIVCN